MFLRKSSLTLNSNSNATKLRSDQQSEKFNMLRNVVENIECPLKRKMLLDFLDQSTLKTEYVTMRESSSSGEGVKGLQKLNKLSKRRHKSPLSVLPKAHMHKKRRNVYAYSQERKRFSLAEPKVRTVAGQEPNLQNFVIERKNGSEEFDSKNGDKCFTEESKEVPLEAILNQLQNYQNPFQLRSRAQSGYSASRDEATHPGDEQHHFEYNIDLEAGVDLEDCKRHRRKEIIVLPADLMDNKNNTGEMAKIDILKKWMGRFRYIMFIFLVLAIVALTLRTIFLEVKVHSYPNKIYALNRKINELHKSSAEWEKRYNECALNNNFATAANNEVMTRHTGGDPVIYAKSSP